MGTFAASRIINRVSNKLFDATLVRWLAPELLTDYIAVINTIVQVRPDEGFKRAAFALTAGTLQTLPADAVQFRRVTRNMGADGATPGPAVTVCDREDIDHIRPEWHTETGTQVKNFIPEKQDMRHFSIYPRPVLPWQVEIAYCATFPTPADANVTFPLPDSYEDTVFYGMMAMAYAKDFDYRDITKVQFYGTLFNQALGLKGASKVSFQPLSAAQEQTADAPGGQG